MCGIIAAAAKRPINKLLIESLKKLEYRGYDSAGLAVIDTGNALQSLRIVGKVKMLEDALSANHFSGQIGIAHTRWATHGAPTERNAHPITSGQQLAIVHNGIIENHQALREKLQGLHYEFVTDTDTETVVHLIHYYFSKLNNLTAAVYAAVQELIGAYSFALISLAEPKKIIAVRMGAPLAAGLGIDENFIASDPLALLPYTRKFIYLEDGDLAVVTADSIEIYDQNQQLITRPVHDVLIAEESIERGQYRHFMQKEIMAQPAALSAAFANRIDGENILPNIFGERSETIFKKITHVQLVSCGTSYHAALVAKYWLETLANIPCSVEAASEFRYHKKPVIKNSLFVVLSQSGETADTLGALRLAKTLDYAATLAICNVAESSMMREAEFQFNTCAGPEIGVASTKAFTTQLIALLFLTFTLRKHTVPQDAIEKTFVKDLKNLPKLAAEILKLDRHVMEWAKCIFICHHALYIGRGAFFPVALEGALKLKEISYIHAEGYAGGELKHGPLALVDQHMPVIAIAAGKLKEKMLSNLQEIAARDGELYILTDDADLFKQSAFKQAKQLLLPKVPEIFAPILYTIPLQLLAYHVAVLKGTDVDQPRNLAKSVTVE